MVRLLAVLSLVALPAGPAVAAAAPVSRPAAVVDVMIKDFAFDPSSVTVHPGDTVRWINKGGTDHTSTSDTGLWDSLRIAPGESFRRTFGTAGTFPYHCAIHPSMKGTVTVR
ncbi:hypothetical protein AF335_08655 [Streptomyces eurocidicus]|uniref:EfeO-type cupredoxin-like domain-containing protein n=1 Tax=Streptomyces eurocidicus TaxID=66423 RepID=A0A2N8P1C9_STREU|nr:plastocyanin [Streptomyces eurocidicus]PNE34830.1 hypothetical protein AF335_08655 [Streptomyces eurocidicus]